MSDIFKEKIAMKTFGLHAIIVKCAETLNGVSGNCKRRETLLSFSALPFFASTLKIISSPFLLLPLRKAWYTDLRGLVNSLRSSRITSCRSRFFRRKEGFGLRTRMVTDNLSVSNQPIVVLCTFFYDTALHANRLL